MPEDEAEAAAQQTPPCAGCRTLRRRCVPGCVFVPFFPADGGGDPSRFAAVHRVFGASNAARMLGDVELPGDRRRAAETLVEEARARLRDPALGCLSYVAVLQMLNDKARDQVAAARAEIAAEFGAAAAAEQVDVAAAPPAARAEAAAQAGRALAHAREQDARLLAARRAADLEWWQQQRKAGKHAGEGPRVVSGGRRKKNRDTNEQMAAETENTAAAAAAAAGESSSEHEQMVVTPPATAGTEMESLPEGTGHPRRQTAEKQEPAPAAEEALASEHAPAAAPPQHDSAATTQLAGAGTGFLDGDQLAAAEALAKRLDTIKRRWDAGHQCHGDPAAARHAAMGLDVTLDAPEEAAAAELAGQEMMQLAQAQYGQTELDVTLGLAIVQQLAGAAKVAGEQDIIPLVATAEPAGEQEIFMGQVAAAELAREQQDMALLLQLQVAAAQQNPVGHQPTVQKILQEQQLANAVGVVGEPNTAATATATTQQVAAAYTDGEHGSDYGAAAAFQPPGLAEAVPFQVEQQTPPQWQTGRALGLQMDSSLPPLPPSLGQPVAQVARQHSTDGGDAGQSSDLTAYVYH